MEHMAKPSVLLLLFFFNDTATTEIYTLSLHDALPIFRGPPHCPRGSAHRSGKGSARLVRSEEHTSELQSRGHLVCRLLLEKKKLVHSHGKGMVRNKYDRFARTPVLGAGYVNESLYGVSLCPYAYDRIYARRIFFFNEPATTKIYTLSLHDALPISFRRGERCWPGRGRCCISPQCNSPAPGRDRKSTRLNSSHVASSYAVFCLK